MEEGFSPEKSHDENVKVAVDKILGQPTSIRKKKKSAEDHKRVLFTRIIDNIVRVEERSIAIDEAFEIDLTKYDRTFCDIIDDLLRLNFTKEQVKLIDFYMYDRYCADGTVLDLIDEKGEKVALDTPTDLWLLIKNVE
jgi:hypothetical protein